MIKVNFNKCKLCGVCKSVCPFSAIDVTDKVNINENCKSCGICVKKCPFNAMEKMEIRTKDSYNEFKDVFVFGEKKGKFLIKAVYELLTKARELCEQLNCNLGLIVIGEISDKDKNVLNNYGISKICILNDKSDFYDNQRQALLISEFVKIHKPDILLFTATDKGREIAPFVASRCKTGITADCTKLEIDKETKLLKQTRPTFGGKLFASITIPNTKPQICTIRAGIFNDEALNKENEPKYLIEDYKQVSSNTNKKILNISEIDERNVDLKNAEIILAGGLGLKNKKNFDKLYILAKLIGAQVAGTRGAVENGFIDKKYQIGQTGLIVSPKIYFAFGVSGAIQHMAGIKNCNYIIAINSDQTAPIFECADYGIVGDATEILSSLIKRLENK